MDCIRDSKRKKLLLSKEAIDVLPYHETGDKVSWKNSSIRKWINNEFISKTFSPEEKDVIQKVSISDEVYSDYSTEDYVFLFLC